MVGEKCGDLYYFYASYLFLPLSSSTLIRYININNKMFKIALNLKHIKKIKKLINVSYIIIRLIVRNNVESQYLLLDLLRIFG